MSFNKIYTNKRVLVTGHTGFKGSWLSLWLTQLGAEVFGIALEPKTESSNFEVTGLKNRINHHICNIKNKKKVQEIFEQIQPQIVFHLAAQALVKQSFDDPVDTYETNVMGTIHILEAIRHTSSIETAVMITSDKCYKNVEWEYGYRESDELGGLDPYGSSKACAELAIRAFRQSFFNSTGSTIPRVASTRAGNVIGGGDWSEMRIVPDIIRALMAKKPVELRRPLATRPWQFVLEPLSGYLWLGARMNEEGSFASGWNFGPENSFIVPVQTLTEKIIEFWGSGSIKDISGKNSFHEATLLSLDISKARHRLQWRPALTMDETIDFTVRWYKEFAENGVDPMYELGSQQIADYTQKALERGIQWAK
jgi:CDP-glucose 4,6-dehydratase